MAINYKKQIQKLTGWDDATYSREYKKIAAQTRNYNVLAGTSYKPAQTLYLSQRYAGDLSAGVADILATPATRARGKVAKGANVLGVESTKIVTNEAVETLKARWGGFIEKSKEQSGVYGTEGRAEKVMRLLEEGKITPKQANDALSKISDSQSKNKKDPAYRY